MVNDFFRWTYQLSLLIGNIVKMILIFDTTLNACSPFYFSLTSLEIRIRSI